MARSNVRTKKVSHALHDCEQGIVRAMIKKAKVRTIRLATQVSALVLLNIPFWKLQSFCAPVFHCHSCPWAVMACPLGVLVNFGTLRVWPLITIGILGIVGTVGGRFVCGWLCPFGLLQDFLFKINSRKIHLSSRLYSVKYVVLAVLVLAVPFFLPGKPYTFCDFCPAGTLESTIPWAFMGVTSGNWARFAFKVAILLGVLGFAVVACRSWCRVFCPLGAIFSLFNRFSIFRFNLAGECTHCGVCPKACPVEIDPVDQMNTEECIRCMECINAKHIKFGSK